MSGGQKPQEPPKPPPRPVRDEPLKERRDLPLRPSPNPQPFPPKPPKPPKE
jgi:hypothetical protein